MHAVRLAALVLPVLLLAACSGDKPGADQSAATASPAEAAVSAPAAKPTPAADKALAPLFGTWGTDPAGCGDKALTISSTAFSGPGSACTVSGYTDNGDGSYTAAMSCTAGGKTADEKVRMRPIFAPTGEGIDLVYLNRDNLKSEVLRCRAGS